VNTLSKDNDFSKRVLAIVNALRASHPCHQKLHIIREGDPLEVHSFLLILLPLSLTLPQFIKRVQYRFFSHFVEDNSKTLPSYYEFLCQLQRQVQTRAIK